MNNMTHCFENIVEEIKWTNVINDGGRFTKPEFVGQGCTYLVGSACYGYYVAEIKHIGKKTIYGLVGADSSFERSWADGSMNCRMPVNHPRPSGQFNPAFGKIARLGKRPPQSSTSATVTAISSTVRSAHITGTKPIHIRIRVSKNLKKESYD